MAGTYRYVKTAKRDSAPTILITAAPEFTLKVGDDPSSPSQRVGVAVWMTVGRRQRDKWYRDQEPWRLDLDDWWDQVDHWCADGRRLHVVAPSAADLLTLSRFWEHTDTGRYRIWEQVGVPYRQSEPDRVRAVPWLGRYVLRSSTQILSCRGRAGSICFTSSSNYIPADLWELAAAVGYPLPPAATGRTDGTFAEVAPADAAAVLCRYYRYLIGWWVANGCGPWRETAGQLALSLWRRRFMTRKVCRHQEPLGVLLEQGALHGGRHFVSYFGDVGEPIALREGMAAPPPPSPWSMPSTLIHRIDVRSQYPTLLRDESYPVKLQRVRDDLTPKTIGWELKHHCVIAQVELDTPAAEYPLRLEDRTIYPVGRFTTTLAGPELEEALREGVVLSVGPAAIYERGEPFRGLMAYLLDMRERFRRDGDPAGELWTKQLMNAFGGKFAQRTYRWVPRPGADSFERWGTFFRRSGPGGKPEKWMAFAGLPHQQEDAGLNQHLLAAVYGYLTAFARVRMRRYRATTSVESTVGQDTDCLWVTDRGLALAKEAKLLAASSPGHLRPCGSWYYSRMFTARHYYQDGRWTLAGVAGTHKIISPTRVIESLRVNPATGIPRKAPRTVYQHERVKDLPILERPPHCDERGWALPDPLPAAT